MTGAVTLASTSPDIRDRIGDAQAGVRTIPVIFGEERTRKIMTGVNLTFGSAILPFSLAYLTPLFTLLVGATVAYAQACIHLLSIPEMRNFVCDILADGQYIFFAGGVMLLSAFGVATGFRPGRKDSLRDNTFHNCINML